jgi:glycine/sarcosine N-methyltransferase
MLCSGRWRSLALGESGLDATTFYDRLAPLFDVMTDWAGRLAVEGPFLRQLLERINARTVLDAACGSGGHALALAEWGYQVVGVDASPAMIELARAKAATADNVTFHVAGLGELASRFRSFDAVLCLGNSLPHLLTEADLLAALADLAACVRPGGLLILHNLNYDRRWQVRPRWFAVNSGLYQDRHALVWRFADYLDAPEPRISFHVALFRQGEPATSPRPEGSVESEGEWSVEVNSTPQRPLFQADLARLLPAAGLTHVVYHGDLKGAPFDPDESPDLVVVASRL